MSHRIIVTGFQGFVRDHLLSHLRQQGFVAIPSEIWLPDRVGFARLVAESQPDAVVHLAAISFLPDASGDPLQAYRVNVDGTRSVLEGLRDSDPEGRTRLVYISSGHIYRSAGRTPIHEEMAVEPRSTYSRTKLAAEIICQLWCEVEPRRPLVIFRPFNHTGPGQRPVFAASSFARQAALIDAGRQEPVLNTGDLSAIRDFCDVRDVVRAYSMAAAGEVPPGIYNLASSRSVSLLEMAEHYRSRCKVKFEIRQELNPNRRGEVREFLGSTRKIHEATGWRAEIPLEKTLDDLLAYWRDRIADPVGDDGGDEQPGNRKGAAP